MNCNVLDAQKCAWCFPKLYRFATGKKKCYFTCMESFLLTLRARMSNKYWCNCNIVNIVAKARRGILNSTDKYD